MTSEEAVRANAALGQRWDAVDTCTIRLLRADTTMPVDRARLLGEDDARREHQDLWRELWRTHIEVQAAREREQAERAEAATMAYGAMGDRMSAAVAGLHDQGT